jgi:hypothetical protein
VVAKLTKNQIQNLIDDPTIEVAKKLRLLVAGGKTWAAAGQLCGASRQAVYAARKRSNSRGRPTADTVRMTMAVPPETGLWIRERAEITGCSVGAVVHDAVLSVRANEEDGRLSRSGTGGLRGERLNHG